MLLIVIGECLTPTFDIFFKKGHIPLTFFWSFRCQTSTLNTSFCYSQDPAAGISCHGTSFGHFSTCTPPTFNLELFLFIFIPSLLCCCLLSPFCYLLITNCFRQKPAYIAVPKSTYGSVEITQPANVVTDSVLTQPQGN